MHPAFWLPLPSDKTKGAGLFLYVVVTRETETHRLLFSVCRDVENIQLSASAPPVLSEDMQCEKVLVLLDHLGCGLHFCSGAMTYYTSLKMNVSWV